MSDTDRAFSNRPRARFRPIFVVIIVGALALQALLISLDTFEWLYHYSRDHEDWELDGVFTIFSVLSFALIAVLIVRNRDLKQAEAERRLAEARLEGLERFDALTGLRNRTGFLDAVEPFLAAAPANGCIGLLLIDLDRFKQVNQRFGTGIGDRLLRRIAARMTEVMAADTIAARLGGDRFALVTPPTVDQNHILRLARRLQAAIGSPEVHPVADSKITASIGIAIHPNDGDGVDILLSRAEAALQQARSEGRNTYALFDAGLERMNRERLEMEAALRAGLARGDVVAHFQPIFDMKTGRPVGAEALARWHRDGHGPVPPGIFIPLAEDAGLIAGIFDTILRQALRELRHWPAPCWISVNLSPQQFSAEGTAARILAVLAEEEAPAGRLCLEITERALPDDAAMAHQMVRTLHAAGVRLALDDFGSGYANLRQLRALPFDKVKIDRSFLDDLGDPDIAGLTARIIDLAHALRMAVVAEGIETDAVAEWARLHDCDMGQGFGLARPMPAEAVRALMTRA
ncbi:EAL domain-containing protein [Zavarzinia compransoris]|uniref:putative bifunctional diguanylate cyclase/phosphodiesterase n=1 Tax=Zavarzinia marina TaxID=2911065 RepID=UPI001F2FE5A9|nr:EAL domain-containing protein [Zavarzinia marina]MCF4166949.1 EAL domain-containing protein [Zavarzinia marina]